MSDEPTKDANAVNLGAIATAFCCAIDDIVFVVLYCIVCRIVYWSFRKCKYNVGNVMS